MTSDADRRLLLKIARDAIGAHLERRVFAPEAPAGSAAARPGGAFVTLEHGGELRGCIGHIEADQPLAQTVARCAIASATEDPRFPAVTPDEFPAIVIELSLLGALEPIGSSVDVEIGRHGLVVEMGWHRGLLLPQVATEWKWDAEMFVMQTCHKAGLPRDAWRHGAKLWRFEAEVFGEPDILEPPPDRR